MAGIINTQECQCCHRMLPFDSVQFVEADEFGPGTWLCADSNGCVNYVKSQVEIRNAIFILNRLLDNVDEWLLSDGPNPGWDGCLSMLASNLAHADKAEVTKLIERMEAKGLPLAAAMLKPESNEEDED